MKNKIFAITGIMAISFMMWESTEKTISDINEYIWIEAESSDELVGGLMVVENNDASEGKAIAALNISHDIKSYALYSLNITYPGEYQFWGRCFWPGGCSNSFYIQVEELKMENFGQDPVQDLWHWVKGPSYKLQKGTYKLKIWNDEFLALLDKMLFTTDLQYIPKGFDETSDYLNDFEDMSAAKFSPLNPERWKVKQDFIENDSLLFCINDIKNPFNLIMKLGDEVNTFSKYLMSQFTDDTRKYIKEFDKQSPISRTFLSGLIDELNQIIQNDLIFRPEKLKERSQYIQGLIISLNYEDVINILSQNPQGKDLIYINRLLIEEAYSDEIRKKVPRKNFAYYLSASKIPDIEYSILNVYSPNDFIFRSRIKSGDQINKYKEANMMFNFQDARNYYYVNLNDQCIKLFVVKNDYIKEIAAVEDTIFFRKGYYNNVTIIRGADNIRIKNEGKIIINIIDNTFKGGRVGIGSKSGDIYFDNIELMAVPSPKFQNNFFESNSGYVQNWNIVNGLWRVCMGGIRLMMGRCIDNNNALITVGEEFWSDYSVRMAVRAGGFGDIGTCFYYQDEKNYYLFKFKSRKDFEKGKGVTQLIKVKNGEETVLAERQECYRSECWYKLEIRLLEGEIHTYIDEQEIFMINDTTFSDGKIGLWTDSFDEVGFDDIKLRPTTSFVVERSKKLDYKFTIQEETGIDFCDWIISSENFFGPFLFLKREFYYKKNMYEYAYMMNKRIFPNNLSVKMKFKSILPVDVDCEIIFYGQKDDTFIEHKFTIGRFGLSLRRDGKIIKENKFNNVLRENILCSKRNGCWYLVVDGKYDLELFDKTEFDSMKVGIGFSGVGKARIKIAIISIESDEYPEIGEITMLQGNIK